MNRIKFLIDENVPSLIKRELIRAGHNIISPLHGSSDAAVARIAKREGCIILTLDKDFTNTVLFPPSEFNIIQIAIHPPEKTAILNALTSLLSTLKPSQLKGLIIVHSKGFSRIE